MVLYFDEPPILSPSMFACAQIAPSGQIGANSATLSGHNIMKMNFDTHPPPTFGYSRLQEIANMTAIVVLSPKSGNYILPNGTLLANVQAAVVYNPFAIVVWDQTDCNGSYYHVYNTFGFPIPNPPFLAVFQELSYAYHATGGPTNGALDALVTAETNMLRGELGLPLRNPAIQSGGCGRGLLPWGQIIGDIVAAVVGFLQVYASSMPRLRQEVVAASLRDALSESGHLITAALIDMPLVRNGLDVVLLGALRSYYDAAALILDKRLVSDDLERQLGHLIEMLLKKMPENGMIDTLVNAGQDSNENLDILNVFIGEPYKVMRRARAQLVAGRSITEVSDALSDSVALWSTRMSQWEPHIKPGGESVASRGGRSNLPFHVPGPDVAAEPAS